MPPRSPGLTGWIARAALVLGGFTMLNALSRRRVQTTGEPEDTSSALGRGAPSVPPSSAAKAAGHETEDMSGRTMARLLVGLGVTVAVVIGLMTVVVTRLSPTANGPVLTVQQTAPITPPAPNLQAAPLDDIATLREREDKLLDNYAWIDPDRTRARIPLQRAMALMVGHSLDTAP